MTVSIGIAFLCLVALGIAYAIRSLKEQDIRIATLREELKAAIVDKAEAKARHAKAKAEYMAQMEKLRTHEKRVAELDKQIAILRKETTELEALQEQKEDQQ